MRGFSAETSFQVVREKPSRGEVSAGCGCASGFFPVGIYPASSVVFGAAGHCVRAKKGTPDSDGMGPGTWRRTVSRSSRDARFERERKARAAVEAGSVFGERSCPEAAFPTKTGFASCGKS